LIGVKPVADGMPAGQTRGDRTNGLVEGKPVGGRRLQLRKAGASEDIVGVLIVQKDHDIHREGLLK
jgi:hypothetical protein